MSSSMVLRVSFSWMRFSRLRSLCPSSSASLRSPIVSFSLDEACSSFVLSSFSSFTSEDCDAPSSASSASRSPRAAFCSSKSCERRASRPAFAWPRRAALLRTSIRLLSASIMPACMPSIRSRSDAIFPSSALSSSSFAALSASIAAKVSVRLPASVCRRAISFLSASAFAVWASISFAMRSLSRLRLSIRSVSTRSSPSQRETRSESSMRRCCKRAAWASALETSSRVRRTSASSCPERSSAPRICWSMADMSASPSLSLFSLCSYCRANSASSSLFSSSLSWRYSRAFLLCSSRGPRREPSSSRISSSRWRFCSVPASFFLASSLRTRWRTMPAASSKARRLFSGCADSMSSTRP